MTTPEPDETPIQRFRVPHAAWEAFGRACRKQGVPRARRLFDLMRADVRRHGSEDDKAAFTAAEEELRRRRSRRHPPTG